MSDAPILAAIAALRSDMATRMDRVEAAQSSLRTELLNELTAVRGVLTERMDRVEAAQSSLRTELLDELTAVRGVLTERMDRVEAAQSSLRTELLDELTAVRGVLMERMDRLQGRIGQLHEDCFLAFAQGETVRRHSDNTRAESHDLAEQVSALARQVRLLRNRIDQIEGP